MAQAPTEPKRPPMPLELLKAAINGNREELNKLLPGLNNEGEDRHRYVKVPIDEEETPMESSVCLIRSSAGMENTILHILYAYGHGDLVSTICEKDSSLLEARNVRNETPFHHAARFGHIEVISELIRYAESELQEDVLIKKMLRQKNCLGETALHEAARHGHEDIINALMEKDLELAGLVNNDSVSPLYLATARGSHPMVQNMVEKLLNHNITPAFYSGPKKQTALHAAVLQDQELTTEILKLYSEPLGMGADEKGRTSFHFTVLIGKHDMAKLLLDIDPSMAYIHDSDGSFPVHAAAQMGDAKMIKLLVQSCPDSGELLDGNGRNFLHIALEAKKSFDIFRLADSGIRPDAHDWKSMVSRKLVIFRLAHSGIPPDANDWKNMFSRMLNTMDNEGNTPLHLAAKHGYLNVLGYLLRTYKLDLTLQNTECLTAFDNMMIQQSKSAITKIMDMDMSDEYYVQISKARCSTGWFEYYKGQMSKRAITRGTILDQISTTEERDDEKSTERDAIKSTERVMTKAQLVGLGSVLIATVSFAAAFTLPGGTNQDTGTPILGRKYVFKAFVLADFAAFFLSFLSTMQLVGSSTEESSDDMDMTINGYLRFFNAAAKCMVLTLVLGLYLVLGPVVKTGKVVLGFSIFLIMFNHPDPIENDRMFLRHNYQIRRTILQPNKKPDWKTLGIINLGNILFFIAPIVVPIFLIFMFALI